MSLKDIHAKSAELPMEDVYVGDVTQRIPLVWYQVMHLKISSIYLFYIIYIFFLLQSLVTS